MIEKKEKKINGWIEKDKAGFAIVSEKHRSYADLVAAFVFSPGD